MDKQIEEAICKDELIVTSVLSGDRNYDARIHHLVRSNYLMSPPMVVAFAIAGNINIDIENEQLGRDQNGQPVYLKDIWPQDEELKVFDRYIYNSEYYKRSYSLDSLSNKFWDSLSPDNGNIYNWNEDSTYIKKSPFLDDEHLNCYENVELKNARALLVLGDSITTDHISPAGKILPKSAAADYLEQNKDNRYNTFGARRGNHEVMLLGAFQILA